MVEVNHETGLLSTMIWLGIDTSTTLCRACLWHAADEKVHIEESQDIGMGHAELLIQQIDMLFEKSTYQRSDVKRIVCSIGPGSFTGVRVGLATAKALAQALNIPVLGVSTLESLALDVAMQPNQTGAFTIALDARRGQAYWQNFDAHGTAQTKASIDKIEALSGLMHRIVAGTGAPLLGAEQGLLPDQACGSMAALMRVAATKPPQTEPLLPLYLRSADAKQPKIRFAVERARHVAP